MSTAWLRAVVAVVLVTACSGGSVVPASTTSPATTGAPSAFQEFGTATVVVENSDGERRLDVWLAADEPQRQRGLMEVTDPDLEGRAGMAFWFDGPTQGGFWMRNTRLPLTIVFVDDEGEVVSIAEMQPCPDTDPSCPVTRPAGTYRWALEVPTDRWDQMGIDTSSTLVLEADDLTATGSS